MYKKMLFLISCVSVLALGGTNMVFGAGVWDTASGEGIEEQLNGGALATGSSDLELVYEDYPGTPQLIGLRFVNVKVPKGVTITNAWVQFTADNEKLTGAAVNLAIWGRLEPNPGAYAGTGAVSSAPRTSVYVNWSNLPDWTSGARGPDQRTPNLSTVIQELVNQPGWASGNALALIIGDDPVTKSTAIRSVLSASNTLALHIEYSSKYAIDPTPADGAILRDTWAGLSWLPGETAASHDVYFGENYDDVKNGTGGTFYGNQATTSFIVGFPGVPYPDGLVPGTTYYWRIDEVEANGATKYEGFIWRFSIPPRTAYNPNPPDGAEFVALDAKLSWTAGFGAKLHTVYLGDNYDTVNNAVGGLPQGITTYTPSALQSEKVYYWRVDEFDATAWHKGQVWAFTTPGAAGDPKPANGAAGVQMVAKLSWTPATNAASHQVYFGTDKDAVKNAATSSPEYKGSKALGAESYDPGKLAWQTPYFWRVDAVYNTGTVKGLVWSFATGDFLPVDDFESYDDIDPPDPASNRIFDKWIDGFATPTTNGALVGNDMPPYAEQSIIHSGDQSMPYSYNNSLKTSEATLTLVYPRDWTEEGVTRLSLWFRGDPANAAERMYVALNGSAVVYNADPKAAQIATWTEWVIDLQAFQGVNLTSVNTITIGFGTKNSPAAGGSGKMYFDDIRLYRPQTAP
jgi:hypothetical protein